MAFNHTSAKLSTGIIIYKSVLIQKKMMVLTNAGRRELKGYTINVGNHINNRALWNMKHGVGTTFKILPSMPPKSHFFCVQE